MSESQIPNPITERIFSSDSQSIKRFALSPDQTILAGATSGSEIYLWNPSTGKLIQQVILRLTPFQIVGSPYWNNESSELTIAYSDGSFYRISKNSASVQFPWTSILYMKPSDENTAFVMMRNNAMFFATKDQFLYCRNSVKIVFTLPEGKRISALALSQEETKLAIGYEDGEIEIRNVSQNGVEEGSMHIQRNTKGKSHISFGITTHSFPPQQMEPFNTEHRRLI